MPLYSTYPQHLVGNSARGIINELSKSMWQSLGKERFVTRLWVVLLFIFALPLEAYTLEKSVLDLRSWNKATTSSFSVKGQAEFFPNVFLSEEKPSAAPMLIDFPGGWNIVSNLPAYGFGSYRMKILLPDLQPFRILLPPVFTATRVFMNGELVAAIGQVARTSEQSAPNFSRVVDVFHQPRSTEVELVIEISNFELYFGGIGDSVLFGTVDAMNHSVRRMSSTVVFIIGALMMAAFYHLGLFWLRPKDRSTLYFALLCLGQCLLQAMGDRTGSFNLIGYPSFHWHVVLYNWGWISTIAIASHYYHSLFPEHFSGRVAKFLSLLVGTYLAIIPFFPVRSWIMTTFAFHSIILGSMAYGMWALAKALKARQDGARLFLFSCSVTGVTIVNDILYSTGRLNSYPIAGFGQVFFALCQAFLLSSRFSRAFVRAETSEAAVRDLANKLKVERDHVLTLNSTLEARVEEQTQDIKSIMLHIHQGIFAIEGPRATIHKDYSAHLEILLDETQLGGKSAIGLMFRSSRISGDAQTRVSSALSACLGEVELNFALNEAIFPRSIVRQDVSGRLQYLDVSWNPVINRQGIIEKVLVAMIDVTGVRQLEEKARDATHELKIVGEILNVKEDEFRRFLTTSYAFIAQNLELLGNTHTGVKDTEILKIIFMNLHTMKGVTRALHFQHLTDVLHTMEQKYSALGKFANGIWDPVKFTEECLQLKQQIDQYQEIAKVKLGRELGESTRLVLPVPIAIASFTGLAELLADAGKINVARIMPLYEALFQNLFLSLQHLLSDIFQAVRPLAKDLDKLEPRVSIECPDFTVSSRTEETLRNIFLHLVRNAMDHGLESTDERQKKGKALKGSIKLLVVQEDDSLCFQLQDDGQGLNLKKLEELGLENGILHDTKTEQDIARVIFASGISTARTVSTISGRGVGLPAVARFVAELGGTTDVVLQAAPSADSGFRPFTLIMRLPLSYFHDERRIATVAA